MFPKKGKYFPNGTRRGKDKIKYPEAIAAALRAELGDSHRAVKSVMRWTRSQRADGQELARREEGASWRAFACSHAALKCGAGDCPPVGRSRADHCWEGALRCAQRARRHACAN